MNFQKISHRTAGRFPLLVLFSLSFPFSARLDWVEVVSVFVNSRFVFFFHAFEGVMRLLFIEQ